MSSIDITNIIAKQQKALADQIERLKTKKSEKEKYQDELNNVCRIMCLTPGERTCMDEKLLELFIKNLKF